jgi:AhpD family alkylhydroperoxidase
MRIQIDPALVSANFAAHANNPSLRESAQLFAAGRPVVEMIQALAMNPRVLRVFSNFADIYPCGGLERSLVEKVILRVSQMHECQFCVNSHTAIMRQLDVAANAETPREEFALEYAEQMTRDANRIPDALFDELRSTFSDPEIVELTFLIGFITMLNRFNNALRIRYDAEYDAVKLN